MLIDESFGQPRQGELFFLHGWGQNRESFRELASLFEGSYRGHLIDLPGFGEAPPPPPDWSTADYAELLSEYLKQFSRARMVVVGHSFGGRIAVRLAGKADSRLAGIVLIGVPGLPIARFSRRSLRRWGIRNLRKLLQLLRPVTGPAPLDWHTARFGSKDYLNAGQLRSLLVRTVNENLTEAAKTIACPSLLLWGSDDREAPAGIASAYARLIRGKAQMIILPHKDHFPFQGTGAHLCALKIRSWLEADVQ